MPISMTWEVYGDDNASYENCYQMFNPTARESLDASKAAWARAMLIMLPMFWQQPSL